MVKITILRNKDKIKIVEGFYDHYIKMGWTIVCELEVSDCVEYTTPRGISLRSYPVKSINRVGLSDDLRFLWGFNPFDDLEFYAFRNRKEANSVITAMLDE